MSVQSFAKMLEQMGGNQRRMDATNPSIFIEQQLRQITTETYNRIYPDLDALKFIPLKTGISPFAMSWSFDSYEMRGSADWHGAQGKDFPRADVSRARHDQPIREAIVGYGYSMSEIETARWAGVPLDQMKADAAKQAMAEFEHTKLLLGDVSRQIPGFLNNPAIPRVVALNGGWATATTDEIYEDLVQLATTPYLATNKVHRPTTILLPLLEYQIIQTRRISNTSETMLEFFRKTSPYIREIEALTELDTAGPGGTATALAYQKDPSVLGAVIPMPFQQLPAMQDGFDLVIPCREKIGGTVWFRPMAAAFLDGIR